MIEKSVIRDYAIQTKKAERHFLSTMTCKISTMTPSIKNPFQAEKFPTPTVR
jgi:hypothetical protein